MRPFIINKSVRVTRVEVFKRACAVIVLPIIPKTLPDEKITEGLPARQLSGYEARDSAAGARG